MTNRLLAAATLAGALTASVAAIAVPQAAHAEQGPWLVRGRLLAVLPDEDASVTVLGGDLDIDQSIVGSIQTGKTLIDESRKKYVEAVHFAMTGTGSGALVVAGQESTYSYSFQIRPAGVSRAKSGRGIRENYLSFGLEKSDGGDFQLDRIEVQIAASINRKV